MYPDGTFDISNAFYIPLGWLILGIALSAFGWPLFFNSKGRIESKAGAAMPLVGTWAILAAAPESFFYHVKADADGVNIRTFALIPGKFNNYTVTGTPREANFKFADLESLEWRHLNGKTGNAVINGVRDGANDKDVILMYKFKDGVARESPPDAWLTENQANGIMRTYFTYKIPELVSRYGLRGKQTDLVLGQLTNQLIPGPTPTVNEFAANLTKRMNEGGGNYSVLPSPGKLLLRDNRTTQAVALQSEAFN